MSQELQSHAGRAAVVTGAAKGIGRAIAEALSAREAAIVLVDREPALETEQRIKAAGGQATVVTGDVTDAGCWQAVASAADKAFGGVNILVNNAGIYPFAHIDKLTYELWGQVLRVNLDSMFLGVKALLPLLRAGKSGSIVNISSNSIGTNLPGLSHYMASKMGVIGFTRGLANDLGADGINVNAVCPAITKTPGTSVLPEEVLVGVSNLQAIKKLAGPQDIVGPIVFLTSAQGAFVTGQTLVVDGGMLKL